MTPPDGWTAEAFVRAVCEIIEGVRLEATEDDIAASPVVRALFPETPPADAPDLTERVAREVLASTLLVDGANPWPAIDAYRDAVREAENARLRAEVARLPEAIRRAYHAGHRAGAINGPLTEEEVGRLFSSAFGGAS